MAAKQLAVQTSWLYFHTKFQESMQSIIGLKVCAGGGWGELGWVKMTFRCNLNQNCIELKYLMGCDNE